ncbi:MAG: ATP synthase F1 subunit epsilon [Candidatus Moraniibacteriota bacterium]|nr:MAG: ATP synthase F1 subunit epsilon [Candidatus Moranbacteria bacterium]
MKSFHFILATPERKVMDCDVVQVTLPVVDGEITILADHIPYVGVLRSGEIRLVLAKDSKKEELALSSGFLEFGKNILTVLADTAERAEEIDIERVEKAVARAKEAKERKDLNEIEYATVAAQLEKELARLRVARKRR